MKTIEFSLSDLSSFASALCAEFSFKEVSYNNFRPTKAHDFSFFRRIFIESGFEVMAMSITLDEDTVFKQKKSQSPFEAAHFILVQNPSDVVDSGIYLLKPDSSISFNFKKGSAIKYIGFMMTNRWIENNLSKADFRTVRTNDKLIQYRKYLFNEKLAEQMRNVHLAAINYSDSFFFLRVEIFSLVKLYYEQITQQKPIEEKKAITIDEFLNKFEYNLSNDFITPITGIYSKCSALGFHPNKIRDAFIKKYHCTPMEYRLKKKLEYSVTLMKTGAKMEEVSKKAGFLNKSAFFTSFTETFKISPIEYINNQMPVLEN